MFHLYCKSSTKLHRSCKGELKVWSGGGGVLISFFFYKRVLTFEDLPLKNF